MLRLRLDWGLILPIFFLACIGLVTLRGISPDFLPAQMGFMAAATVAFIAANVVGHYLLFSLHWPIYALSMIFLFSPFVLGIASRGAHRWIQLSPSLSLQPSELIKPFLLITFVSIAVSDHRYKLPLLILAGLIPTSVIFLQPDLSTAIVIMVGWFTIFLSKVRLKLILAAMLMFFIAAVPIYQLLLHDYQKDRLRTFIDPYSDPLGRGYHVIQSLIAVGSGGWFGRGLGQGPQSDLRFLPEHHTDFVFASIGESFGFVGSATVIILFLFLIRRIYNISQATTDQQASLFCLAAASLLAFQAAANIGMNLGIVPVTGITLPFLSYGGSSLLSVSFTLGLVNSISMARRYELSS